MNLLDGMDGLASGVSAISALFLGLAAMMLNENFAALMAFSLFGSCLGFLFHNYHPAKIFMGDVGSLFLGVSLAVIGIRIASQPFEWRRFFGPVLILGVPLLDTFLAILRRIGNMGGIISGDRRHLYDRVYQFGFSIRKTVLIMYGLAIVFGMLGLLVTTRGMF